MQNRSQALHDELEAHWHTTELPNLNDEEARACQLLQYPTQEIIVKQGQPHSAIYFVAEGVLLEQQIDHQGTLTPKGLYSDGDWLMSLCHLSSTVSDSLIESLTPCQLIELPIDLVQTWRNTKSEKWPALLEVYCQQLEQRRRMSDLDSQLIYQSLLSRYPDLVNDFTVEQCQQCVT